MLQRPALGKVPSIVVGTSDQNELVIKAGYTGITFLGHYDPQFKKYISDSRYRKRYTGSKTCEVDINGQLYTSRSEYNKAVNHKKIEEKKKLKEKEKLKAKKKQGRPPASKLLYCVPGMEPGAISDKNPTCENLGEKKPVKVRKKSYTVNGKEVRQRVYGMLNTQKGRKQMYFFTVSFPDKTPDHIAHQALNTWFTSLRKYKMLHDYLWVKERQDGKRLADPSKATNTLHFHIAIPHYLNVVKANAMMRGTLKTFAERGNIPYNPRHPQIAKYNGVHISKHKNTNKPINFALKKAAKALAHYLTKYLTKTDENGNAEEFEQLAWHNSRGFSALFTGVTFTLSEFIAAGHGHFLNRVRTFKMRFALFIPWLMGPPPKIVEHLFQLNSYILQTLDNGTATKQSTAKGVNVA